MKIENAERFCKFMFGDNVLPCKDFEPYFNTLLTRLGDEDKLILYKVYVLGVPVNSPSDYNGLTGSSVYFKRKKIKHYFNRKHILDKLIRCGAVRQFALDEAC